MLTGSIFNKARDFSQSDWSRVDDSVRRAYDARNSLERLAEQVRLQNEFQELPFVEDTRPRSRYKYLFPTDYPGSGYFDPPTLDQLRKFVPNIGVVPSRPERRLTPDDLRRWQDFINDPTNKWKL